MKPSQYYSLIDEILGKSDTLANVPRHQNTYQETLLEGAQEHLKEQGLVICYYFHRTGPTTSARRGRVQAQGMFTFAVVENVAQHKAWTAANPTITDFRSKTALEVAEELVGVLSSACELRGCGNSPDGPDFGEKVIERMGADGGLVQFDVSLSVPVTMKPTS